MKLSEAKILIRIQTMDSDKAYLAHLAVKSDMSKDYMLTILHSMKFKGWLRTRTSNFTNKIFYEITREAPIKEARELHQNVP